MSVYQEFFTELWSGLHGRAGIATMNGSNEPSSHRFFAWPEQSEDLFEYVAEHETEDTYFFPTLFKANRAKKSVAKASHVVHADDDGFMAAGGQYRLTPSIQVHTSPGHTHVYWLIADTDDPAVIEPLSHAVSNAHSKAEGTDDGWAINKLLRVPGTYNTQYANPASKKYREDGEVYEVTLERTDALYTVAQFSEAYAPSEAAASTSSRDMGTLPSRTEALKSLPYSPKLDELLDKNYVRRHVDRSDALFLLENELFRLGASDETAFVICQTAPMNKFAEDGKPNADELLWQDILRARAKSDLPAVPTEDMEPEVTVTVAPTRKPKSIDFLSAEEKGHMAPTFVDDYLAWASSKTDAAHEFHIASAFTILSAIFSDYGHAIPKFGRLPLNMWFMVLGETTRSRKSTTRGQMLSFIKALSDEEKYTYDLGSDVTPEALDNALLERANRSSLVHRDEVQGWLHEMDSKNYMAGAKGKFTELYDGHVSGKLRATGEVKRKASVNVSLVLFTMGIRGQVADFLTQEDFQSGFLTRFIYVEADAPKRTPESDYLEQADISEVKEGDVVFTDLVSRLEQSREHWDDFVPVDGPTRAVPCSVDAWARLNRFITDILDEAEGHERHAIIEASSQRLSLSILKAATLLAMFDCCDEVQLPHMLSAINFCSSWFLHMVSMANKISESSWQRRVDQVENHLLSMGGNARWDRCYGKFKADLKPREFLEIVQALQEAGTVHVFKDDKQVRWIEIMEAAA